MQIVFRGNPASTAVRQTETQEAPSGAASGHPIFMSDSHASSHRSDRPASYGGKTTYEGSGGSVFEHPTAVNTRTRASRLTRPPGSR